MVNRSRLDTVGSHALQLDLDALPIPDRAVLRLLTRADAATASQLARLIYGRERTAQERLPRLMHGLARSGDLARRTPLDRPSIRSRTWDSNRDILLGKSWTRERSSVSVEGRADHR
jgi:hypothetical protein